MVQVQASGTGGTYFNAGIKAALAQDTSIAVSTVAPTSLPSSACSSSTLFVFGITQTSGLADALDTSKACGANSVMNVGSFTEGMTYRVWNRLSYFTQTEDTIQNALAARYVVTELRLRRVALLSVAAYGSAGNALQVAYLKSAGYVEKTDYTVVDTSSSSAYSSFQSFKAQAVMLFDFTTSFVSQLLKDTSQGSIVMFTGLYSMSALMAQITANLAYSSQRLFIASPNQMASETSLNYITLFNSQFSAANSG
eukprot:gene1110-biopygen908